MGNQDASRIDASITSLTLGWRQRPEAPRICFFRIESMLSATLTDISSRVIVTTSLDFLPPPSTLRTIVATTQKRQSEHVDEKQQAGEKRRIQEEEITNTPF